MRLQWDFFAQQFPRDIAEDHKLAEDESTTHSPLNYDEAIIVLLDCWRSLMLTFNRQLIMEKDLYATNIQN